MGTEQIPANSNRGVEGVYSTGLDFLTRLALQLPDLHILHEVAADWGEHASDNWV